MKKLWASVVVLAVALVVFPGCSKKSASGSSAKLTKKHPALESLVSQEPNLDYGSSFWQEEARKAGEHARANTPVADWKDTVWDEGVRICREPAVSDLPNCAHFRGAIQTVQFLTASESSLRDPEFIPAYRLGTGTEPPAELLLAIENSKRAPAPMTDDALGTAISDVLPR